jgi:hypothetical protein
MVSITLLDIVILAFLLAEIVLSARRGFSLTSCAVVGNLGSLLFAVLCAAVGTPALAAACQGSVGKSALKQLALPDALTAASSEAGGILLQAMEAVVLRPLVFAVGFLLFTVAWQYACLHFGLQDRFPRSRRFEQLYGGALGLLRGLILTGAVVYVLSALGILPVNQIRGSILLGRLWGLWHGA